MENPYQAPHVSITSHGDESFQPLKSPYGGIKKHVRLSLVCITLLVMNALAFVVAMAFVVKNHIRINAENYIYTSPQEWELVTIKFMGATLLVSFFLLLPLYGWWTNRSMKNAWVIPHKKAPKMTPALSVIWYLVPVANLWMPLVGIREIWERTFSGRRSQAILYVWWASLLFCLIHFSWAIVLSLRGDELVLGLWSNLAILLVHVCSPLFLAYIIRIVMKRQLEFYHLSQASQSLV